MHEERESNVACRHGIERALIRIEEKRMTCYMHVIECTEECNDKSKQQQEREQQ